MIRNSLIFLGLCILYAFFDYLITEGGFKDVSPVFYETTQDYEYR